MPGAPHACCMAVPAGCCLKLLSCLQKRPSLRCCSVLSSHDTWRRPDHPHVSLDVPHSPGQHQQLAQLAAGAATAAEALGQPLVALTLLRLAERAAGPSGSNGSNSGNSSGGAAPEAALQQLGRSAASQRQQRLAAAAALQAVSLLCTCHAGLICHHSVLPCHAFATASQGTCADLHVHGIQVQGGLAGPPQAPPQLQDGTARQAALQQQLAQLADAGLLTDVSRC